ncbi:MAG TPA: hypothetical protein VIO60_04410 [Rectinemataceae bacterium]
MLFIDRPDGTRVRSIPALNALMPYMMPGRNNSAVYYERTVDLENALRLVKTRNWKQDEAGQDKEDTAKEGSYSLFGIVLGALVRTVALKPRLNRFVHGKTLYQRNHISVSFIAKQRLSEEAVEASVKLFFDPEEGLPEVMRKMNEAIRLVRERGEGGDGDRIAKAAHAIPGGKSILIGIYRFLDRINLAPWSLIKADPLFATAYFANLGSLGLDAPFHHLYEWGNASIFMAMGKLEENRHGRNQGSRRCITFRITLDERIADGLYFARALSTFARLLDSPELLECTLEDARKALAGGKRVEPELRDFG